MTDAPHDPEPIGWYLGRDTWLFHQHFYRQVGRPAAFREYSNILWSIRYDRAEKLGKMVYRVTLMDEQQIIVKGGRHKLQDVLAPDWQPPVRKPAAVAAAAPKPKPEPPQPPKPPPEPPRPAARASTLTLGVKGGDKAVAAKVLTSRLKRIGIQPNEVTGA